MTLHVTSFFPNVGTLPHSLPMLTSYPPKDVIEDIVDPGCHTPPLSSHQQSTMAKSPCSSTHRATARAVLWGNSPLAKRQT